MINCHECNKRINSNHAVKFKGKFQEYCKSCYEQLFGATDEDSCHYCKNFTYARGQYGYLEKPFTLPGDITGLFGVCEKHNKTVTTHSQKCEDYTYAFKDETPYCTKEHIIKDCALNDNCRRADFNCDECHTKKFWEEVIANKDHHVIGSQWSDGQIGVDSFTHGEGGYYNRRFDIHFEDGEILENMGMWSRGRVPNKRVYNSIRHAKIIPR